MLLIASHVLVLTCCFPKKTQLRELPKNRHICLILFGRTVAPLVVVMKEQSPPGAYDGIQGARWTSYPPNP